MVANFLNETANYGTTDKLSKAKKATHRGQTVTDMRQDLISRAQDTVKALEAHKSGPLRAPMARSIRNGFEVKIGYGKRNAGFFEQNPEIEEHKAEGKKPKPVAVIPARNFARGEAFAAIAYLRKVIDWVQTGGFDALLTKALADMTSRFSTKQEDEPADEQQDELAEEQEDNVLLFAGE